MHVARDYWNGACQMSRLMLASHQEVTAVNQAVPDCNRTWKKMYGALVAIDWCLISALPGDAYVEVSVPTLNLSWHEG